MENPAETSRAESSLTQQAFWLLFARAIGVAVGLALPLVMVRIFDRSAIGVYRQIFLIITTAVNLLPLGFEMSAFYYLPREKDRAPMFVLNIVVFLAAVGAATCLVLIAWPEVLRYIIRSDDLTQYGPLIGLTILTWMASSFLETVATAREEVKLSTIFIITAQVTKTLFLTAAALTFRTIDSLLYAAIVQGLLQFLILAWYLQRSFPGLWTRFDFGLFRDQTAYVIPFGLSAIVFTAQSDLHTYLVANRFSPADYALYSVGTVQLPLIGLLQHAVNVVLLPKISRLQQNHMHTEIRLLMLSAVRKLSLVYIPITVVMLVLGREFLTTMYTSEYIGSWPFFAVNVLSMPLYAINMDAVVRAYAQYRFTMLILRTGMLAVLVNASIVAMNHFGMIGAIAAFTISGAIERVFLFTLCMRILEMKRADWQHLKDVLKAFVAAACAASGAFAIRALLPDEPTQLVLILGLTVYGLLYAALILGMRVLHRDEKEMINEYTLKYLSVVLFREHQL